MEGIMMWCYVQLPGETQFAYSETRDDGTVEIAIERPRDWGFDTAKCFMPAYRWFEVDGFPKMSSMISRASHAITPRSSSSSPTAA